MAAKKKTVTSKKTSPRKAKAGAPATEKEQLCVFAFRLSESERDAIHRASGPRGAARFVRRVAVAFAQENEAAFREVLKEAQAARSVAS